MSSARTLSSGDKKRKQADMSFDKSDEQQPSQTDPQLDFLPKMVRFLEEMRERDERGESTNNRNQEILSAKSQVEQIREMKRALDEYSNSVYVQLLEKQEARIRGLFDSTSPMLSLNKPVLQHLIGYLDEEALLSLEEASTTVQQYFATDALVELHARRKQQGIGYFPVPLNNSTLRREPSPRERAQRYAKAANFVRSMETLAASHYNYDQDQAGEMEVQCSGCEAPQCRKSLTFVDLLSGYGRDHDSIFVRLASRTTKNVIWQGFVSHHSEEYFSYGDDDYAYGYDSDYSEQEYQRVVVNMDAVVGEMDWPELKEYTRMLSTGSSESTEQKEVRLKELATNLLVTVALVPDTSSTRYAYDGHEPQLLVATGGCGRCEYSSVLLQPRNKRMHDTMWGPKNFIETSIDIPGRNKLKICITDDNPFEHDR